MPSAQVPAPGPEVPPPPVWISVGVGVEVVDPGVVLEVVDPGVVLQQLILHNEKLPVSYFGPTENKRHE